MPGFLKGLQVPTLENVIHDKAEYFYFALECEHRWRSITSEEALRCAIERVWYCNYDWTEAIELSTNYSAAYEIINCGLNTHTSKLGHNNKAMEADQRLARSDEVIRSFPEGREANMQMIKALLEKQSSLVSRKD